MIVPGRRGVLPGTFDPPTRAHLAIAEAARRQCELASVDLALSRVPLEKSASSTTTIELRTEVLAAIAATRPWLGVVTTEARLIADIASGYDVVILGADKWDQIRDERWYGGPAARDEAMARLPEIVVAPRADHPTGVAILEIPETYREISSTRARAGEHDMMLPEVAAFARRTGAWPVEVV